MSKPAVKMSIGLDRADCLYAAGVLLVGAGAGMISGPASLIAVGCLLLLPVVVGMIKA